MNIATPLRQMEEDDTELRAWVRDGMSTQHESYPRLKRRLPVDVAKPNWLTSEDKC